MIEDAEEKGLLRKGSVIIELPAAIPALAWLLWPQPRVTG